MAAPGVPGPGNLPERVRALEAETFELRRAASALADALWVLGMVVGDYDMRCGEAESFAGHMGDAFDILEGSGDGSHE